MSWSPDFPVSCLVGVIIRMGAGGSGGSGVGGLPTPDKDRFDDCDRTDRGGDAPGGGIWGCQFGFIIDAGSAGEYDTIGVSILAE